MTKKQLKDKKIVIVTFTHEEAQSMRGALKDHLPSLTDDIRKDVGEDFTIWFTLSPEESAIA